MIDNKALLRKTFALAERAKLQGNMPFGALLANAKGEILLTAENAINNHGDCTAHAELILLQSASRTLAPEILQSCTLFASTEPCPMCAGALFWSGITRLVYALSARRFFALVNIPEYEFPACRDILCVNHKTFMVTGPLLEDEAASVHANYWEQFKRVNLDF